jgi:hypothetical protein
MGTTWTHRRRPVGRGVVIPPIIIRAMMILRITDATRCSTARWTGLRIRDRCEQPNSHQQQKAVPYHKSSS